MEMMAKVYIDGWSKSIFFFKCLSTLLFTTQFRGEQV